MHLPGGFEWVILLVIALLLFGGSRLAGMGKGAGKAIREFKEELGTSANPPAVTPGSAPPVTPPSDGTEQPKSEA